MTDDETIPHRASGVLLHPTSLPGPGIGDFGPAAHALIDWLAEAGQSYWQILPLVPVDSRGSPYSGFAALAGNPLLISPELLCEEGLIGREVLDGIHLPDDHVDFSAVTVWKEELLAVAHRSFERAAGSPLRGAFERFRRENGGWLSDFALFRALRAHFDEAPWVEWPEAIRRRQPGAVAGWRTRLAGEVERYEFQQFLFHRQWKAVRGHAARRGVSIIGDLPIFVAHDSVDVWANPAIFQLDEEGMPTVVAGVPPDYFSATGQRWGNPLYRWDVLEADGYRWWVERFRRTLQMVDVVRVDHFRGFQAYWEIPASEETAAVGRWVAGPGESFFRAVEERLGTLKIIAEDLGIITAEVSALCEALGYPGMRVLQFAFDGDPTNPHLPENYPARSVAFTGTHDNDTIVGWWASASAEERARARARPGLENPDSWDFVSEVFASPADLAIVPVQDLLGYGSASRMNVPGRADSNWSWRIRTLPPADLAVSLRSLTMRTGRYRERPPEMGAHEMPREDEPRTREGS